MKKIKIYNNYNLKNLTTFKIGGRALFFCRPKSLDELKNAFLFAEKNNLKIYIIACGSNILIPDAGLDGLVISTSNLNKISIADESITAEAGVSINKLNKKLLKYSYSGMEFTSGLPGSIGGAIYMNARAYGREISEVVAEVTAVNIKGEIFKLNKNDLEYSYKKSIFMKKKDLIIINAVLKLKKGNYREISNLYKKNLKDRILKNQFKYPCAGCIFKNDPENNIIAGRIIDELGLKQTRIGGAEISKDHANFIINAHKAKAVDVLKLIELIEKQVYEKKGIKLEREVILLEPLKK